MIMGANWDPPTVQEAVGQAIGRASVCWDNMRGAGVFQDQDARRVSEELVAWIETHYEPKKEPSRLVVNVESKRQ